MKTNHTFERREKYLYLIVTGEYDKTEFLAYPALIRNECEKEKIFKVLVNALDLKNSDVPAMDRFYMGEEIAKSLGPKIRIAVAWQQEHIDKFAENVAVNRGGIAHVTGDVASAEKWLLDGELKA